MSITVSGSAVPTALADLATAVAQAAAPMVPAGETLTAGPVQEVGAVDAKQWAAGAVAPLVGTDGSVVGLLVGSDLADALGSAPGGALDLGAALQPALDAMAVALGSSAGAGEAVTGRKLGSAVKNAAVAVPLLAGDTVIAVVLLGTPASAAATQPAAPAPDPARAVAPARGVELLHGVAMEVTVELGRTRLSVRDLLALTPGDVLELDRAAGSHADLLVNGRLIARGEVVVVDEDFALRVTEIVSHSAAG
jgi:flagellar motor switch protein FliN/FliY